MSFYRFVCGNVGIYEAVDRDCPRSDARREGKPDAAWLPKVGPKFLGAISFWTEHGLRQYLRSGLQVWHCSVVDEDVSIVVAPEIERTLHSDDFQVICEQGAVRNSSQMCLEEFLLDFVLSLERVDTTAEALVQEILEGAPTYTLRTEGVAAIPTDGRDTLSALPPGCTLEQKYVVILRRLEAAIGVADVISGYPDSETAFLGLMLLRENFQGGGNGRLFYRKIEKMAAEQLGCKKIRLAVVDSNPVLPFWEKMGFHPIGDVRPHEGRNLKSLKRVMEKAL